MCKALPDVDMIVLLAAVLDVLVLLLALTAVAMLSVSEVLVTLLMLPPLPPAAAIFGPPASVECFLTEKILP